MFKIIFAANDHKHWRSHVTQHLYAAQINRLIQHARCFYGHPFDGEHNAIISHLRRKENQFRMMVNVMKLLAKPLYLILSFVLLSFWAVNQKKHILYHIVYMFKLEEYMK